MSNPLPSTEQDGAQTDEQVIDEQKYEQSAAIHTAIRRENRRESH